MKSKDALLNISAASSNLVSALLAFHRRGFGIIVLIIVVIAAVHATQTISQSNKLDFLPPDVGYRWPALEGHAALHVAVIYKQPARGGGGGRGGRAEACSLLGDCFWSLVQVPRHRLLLSSC